MRHERGPDTEQNKRMIVCQHDSKIHYCRLVIGLCLSMSKCSFRSNVETSPFYDNARDI
jgi:hypothetical protein